MLIQRLKSLLKPVKTSAFIAELKPDEQFYAIGDIHGRDDLLEDLLETIFADAEGSEAIIVCVGDYIDRGENSAAALRRLHGLSKEHTNNFICLLGNHEEMMLAFLDDPKRKAGVWLRNGGLQTLASFQIEGARQNMSERRLTKVRKQLEEALGADMIDWLRALPSMWSSGNVTVVHAGADPDRRLEGQHKNDLTWGHRNFLSKPRQDGQWIVHGHTIVSKIEANDGRIGVDTGAFATGRLSAASISASGVRSLISSVRG